MTTVDEAAPLRVLVADDELIARRRLLRLLGAMPDVAVAGECESGAEVLARVRSGGVDVVLLDIRMPGLDGVETLALLSAASGPRGLHVVFVTAHPDHAVAAFDGGAADYLLKPVEPARLAKALERVRERRASARPALASPSSPTGAAGGVLSAPLERLAISTRQGIVLVDPLTVSHALLDGELVTLHTAEAEYLTDFTLQELQKRLPADRFARVHRRALLNLGAVARLEPLATGGYLARTHAGHAVEVSRQAARALRRRLGLRKPLDEDDAPDDE